VSPKKHLESCFVPILFLHGDEDGFVQPHHSEILKQGWQGEASRFTMPSTDHNDHRQEKFLARATLFMVRALRWEDYLDQMALKILEHGLLPTQANRQIVEQKVNGSATLRAAAEFEQLALSEDIRKMTACKDPAVRQQGLVLAAAELSGAYRGAERLAVGQSGSLKMQMPAAFQGKICFAKDDTEVAFGWTLRHGAEHLPRDSEALERWSGLLLPGRRGADEHGGCGTAAARASGLPALHASRPCRTACHQRPRNRHDDNARDC
ncbi:unnamed protein product, partial [Symbiodinium microadriaticum]